jgi:hypothetical protein
MDFSKYPIEKLFYFVLGIIPGFTALFIYQLAVPGAFNWFFASCFLGYKMKLVVATAVAFVVGNSMTTFLSSILGAIGGAVYGGIIARRPQTPYSEEATAPWRDPRWRGVLKRRLGDQAPKDLQLIAPEVFAWRMQLIDAQFQDEATRNIQRTQLNLEKIGTEINDGQWAQWYDFYHQVLGTKEREDIEWFVHRRLSYNLEVAAIYVLFSAIVVPQVRHRWYIAPSVMWVVILIAFEYTSFRRFNNKWATLLDQIRYLSEQDICAGKTT